MYPPPIFLSPVVLCTMRLCPRISPVVLCSVRLCLRISPMVLCTVRLCLRISPVVRCTVRLSQYDIVYAGVLCYPRPLPVISRGTGYHETVSQSVIIYAGVPGYLLYLPWYCVS